MRIAALADVHANLPALRAVLDDAARCGCDRIYHAGDLIAIGPYPAEVVDLARASGMQCVQGNHEEWLARGLPPDPTPAMDDEELRHQHWTHSRLDAARRNYLRTLPYVIDEVLDGLRVIVVHFALDADGNERRFSSIDFRSKDEEVLDAFSAPPGSLVCFGHLHGRRIFRERGGCLFLNPGTVGCGREPVADYAVVRIERGRCTVEDRRVPYDRTTLLARYDELEVPARDSIRRQFFGAPA